MSFGFLGFMFEKIYEKKILTTNGKEERIQNDGLETSNKDDSVYIETIPPPETDRIPEKSEKQEFVNAKIVVPSIWKDALISINNRPAMITNDNGIIKLIKVQKKDESCVIEIKKNGKILDTKYVVINEGTEIRFTK